MINKIFDFSALKPKQKEKKNYVDACMTYETLLQDSGLLPKPKENWNTFVPKENDLALVNGEEYIFRGGKWEQNTLMEV